MKKIIRSVLQTHFTKLGTFDTAWEGITNDVKLPYQAVYLSVSSSLTGAISSKPHGETTGFMQITLYYPSGNGTSDIEDRAELIRTHFYGISVIQDNVQVVIHSPPVIGGVFFNDNKLALPVTINYSAYELNKE